MWNYIVAHWQGRLGLLRSFLLNGVMILVLLFIAAAALSFGASDSQIVICAWAGMFVVWAIWACVGVFRCGARNVFDRTNGKARRIGALIAMLSVVVFAWFTGKDVYYLFVRPIFLHLLG
jgi:hypothetical protein